MLKNRNILVFFVFILFSCSGNRLSKLENSINLDISQQKDHMPFELVLDTISSFKWDELLIAGPYTDLNSIKEYKLDKFSNSIKHYDTFTLFGFLYKKRGVNWIELKGNKIFSPFFKDSNGYKIYSKSDCKFILNN